MRAQLEEIAAELDVAADADGIERLLELVRLWRAYAPAINLVGAHDDVAMIGHVADGLATVSCAAGLQPMTRDTTWLDVGSGAGLPGLVIAATTECRVVLAEPRQRRAAFLELALATIGRSGSVIRSRIDEKTWTESVGKQVISADIAAISIASARAVMDVDSWLVLGEKLVMDGGVVIAHERPEHSPSTQARPAREVVWGRSKILGYRTPIVVCST
ncbi:MAG TPA: RsmG family class I SAM-dependent methyltransferase [Nannocystaceae bacterium]|nr:RsmG family class I SAM-dependent methyltransferase [Nannocystaceae bacterium]